MQMVMDNTAKNTQHYDQRYRSVRVDCIVNIVRGFQVFLDDAVQTDTSWHGFYKHGFAQRLAGKRVLELGCGDGLNALIMASLGAHVVANEISAESMRIVTEAAATLNLSNVETLLGDFGELSIEERAFDFVVGKAILHHLTHDIEEAYVGKITRILKPTGEARFFEPAVNSRVLDAIRWLVPVPGRPSMLSRKAFAAWKAADPHPDRDNSSAHYRRLGNKYFDKVDIEPIGSLERLCRWMPRKGWSRAYRRWAHRVEVRLPQTFRNFAARSQLIEYRLPRTPSRET
ncbi:MAG: class I SAM-dependent methyltransferase [Pirellulaceae bacterium]